MKAMGHAVFWRESVVTIELSVYALAVEERCTLTYNFTLKALATNATIDDISLRGREIPEPYSRSLHVTQHQSTTWSYAHREGVDSGSGKTHAHEQPRCRGR